MEGLQILKPLGQKGISVSENGMKQVETGGGINLEAQMVMSGGDIDDEMSTWVVENLKFSVKQPVMRFGFPNYVRSVSCWMEHSAL